MSRPTVSVVLAVYDAAWCIRRALDTVVAQTHPPLEILVCDDGSRDGTPELVERTYGEAVRVLRLPHRNASAARHDGLAVAQGDWLAFLDADDWWERDKIEKQLDFVARHPRVRWLSSDGRYESEQGLERDSWLSDYFHPVSELAGDLLPPLMQRCFPLMSSMLVERHAYHEAGGIDPAIVYSHDYDLWLRLAARFDGGLMPELLVHYWTHPGALSKNFEGRHRDDLRLMQRAAAGGVRSDEAVISAARLRVAALQYHLGQRCLRTGRGAEGRALLSAAAARGPALRRVLATLGSLTPDPLLPLLKRVGLLRTLVARARGTPRPLDPRGGA